MIALELFPALCVAGLGKVELALVAEVLAACYGPQKREWHAPDTVIIGHLVSTRAGVARVALDHLICKRIFLPVPGVAGAYSFNKDWESWMTLTDPPAPLLGYGQADFVRSCFGRFAPRASKSTPKKRVSRTHQNAGPSTLECTGRGGDDTLECTGRGGDDTQECPAPGGDGTPKCSGGLESLVVGGDVTHLPANDLPSLSRAGAGTLLDKRVESKELKESPLSGGPGGDDVEDRCKNLLDHAKEHVHFLADDMLAYQLDGAIRQWLAKPVPDHLILAAFQIAGNKLVKPRGFLGFVSTTLQGLVEREKALAASVDAVGSLDGQTHHPAPGRPVAGLPRPSKADLRAADAAAEVEAWAKLDREAGR